MAVLRPPLTEEPVMDSWTGSVAENVNLNEERLDALLVAMQSLPDGASVDQLRDAIIAALSG